MELLLLLLFFGARLLRRPGGLYVIPSEVGSARVGPRTEEQDGWILTSPTDLARAARLDLRVYTLARFIASEAGRASALEKAAIAWSIVNAARRKQRSLLSLATFTRQGDRGLYGRQYHGRFASTHADPTAQDRYVAERVFSGAWPDPTGGADQFFSPGQQRLLHARTPCPQASGPCWDSPEAVLARWIGDGRKQVVVVADVDPERQVFIRPV